MQFPDRLIEDIIGESQIPWAACRQDVARELRAHIEDFILIAKQGGYSDEEIRRLVLANFGNPKEIAREFAVVYRRERAIYRISVFLLATLVAGSIISAAVLAIEAGIALGLGLPVPRILGGRHLAYESLYILFTAASYVGLFSLEKIYAPPHLLRNSLAVLTGLFAAVLAACALGGIRIEIPALGFFSGVLLRMIELFLKRGPSRICAALVCFGGLGLGSVCSQWPGESSEIALKLSGWVAIGILCYLMTYSVARLDRALFGRVTPT